MQLDQILSAAVAAVGVDEMEIDNLSPLNGNSNSYDKVENLNSGIFKIETSVIKTASADDLDILHTENTKEMFCNKPHDKNAIQETFTRVFVDNEKQNIDLQENQAIINRGGTITYERSDYLNRCEEDSLIHRQDARNVNVETTTLHMPMLEFLDKESDHSFADPHCINSKDDENKINLPGFNATGINNSYTSKEPNIYSNNHIPDPVNISFFNMEEENLVITSEQALGMFENHDQPITGDYTTFQKTTNFYDRQNFKNYHIGKSLDLGEKNQSFLDGLKEYSIRDFKNDNGKRERPISTPENNAVPNISSEIEIQTTDSLENLDYVTLTPPTPQDVLPTQRSDSAINIASDEPIFGSLSEPMAESYSFSKNKYVLKLLRHEEKNVLTKVDDVNNTVIVNNNHSASKPLYHEEIPRPGDVFSNFEEKIHQAEVPCRSNIGNSKNILIIKENGERGTFEKNGNLLKRKRNFKEIDINEQNNEVRKKRHHLSVLKSVKDSIVASQSKRTRYESETSPRYWSESPKCYTEIGSLDNYENSTKNKNKPLNCWHCNDKFDYMDYPGNYKSSLTFGNYDSFPYPCDQNRTNESLPSCNAPKHTTNSKCKHNNIQTLITHSNKNTCENADLCDNFPLDYITKDLEIDASQFRPMSYLPNQENHQEDLRNHDVAIDHHNHHRKNDSCCCHVSEQDDDPFLVIQPEELSNILKSYNEQDSHFLMMKSKKISNTDGEPLRVQVVYLVSSENDQRKPKDQQYVSHENFGGSESPYTSHDDYSQVFKPLESHIQENSLLEKSQNEYSSGENKFSSQNRRGIRCNDTFNYNSNCNSARLGDSQDYLRKHIDEWTSSDAAFFLVEACRELQINLQELNLQSVQSGRSLLYMIPSDFENIAPNHGQDLYDHFVNFKMQHYMITEIRNIPNHGRSTASISQLQEHPTYRDPQYVQQSYGGFYQTSFQPDQNHPPDNGNSLSVPDNKSSTDHQAQYLVSSQQQSSQDPNTYPSTTTHSSDGTTTDSLLKDSSSLPSAAWKSFPPLHSYGEEATDLDAVKEVDPSPPKRRGPGRPPKPENERKRKPSKTGRLWEFIRNLLLDPKTCPSLLRWENAHDGVFRIVQSDVIANKWGMRKNNQKMNYEKLSRAMRYYYKAKIFEPVIGKRLVYKFGSNARGWRPLNPNNPNFQNCG